MVFKERKDTPQTWRKYLQSMYLRKDLYLEYVKNSQNSVIRKKNPKNVHEIWLDAPLNKKNECK